MVRLIRIACRILLPGIVSVAISLPHTIHAEATQEIRDLHYGETLFHFYQGKYFSALSDLLIAKKKHPIKNHGNEPELLLGGLYLSYDMHKPAAEVFQQLAQTQQSNATQDATWYYLAKLAYQKNDLDTAVAAIEKVSHYLPYQYNDEFQHLKANIYLKLNRYGDAIKTLKSFSGKTDWANYAKYNLAIALIKSKQSDEGMRLLHESAANDSAVTAEQIALRDKANMALGFASIRNNTPKQAMQYFNRIQLLGLQSNKALLGTGWALYQAGLNQEALAPWLELKQRSRCEPAVQEALLTIPHALEQLDAKQEALAYYKEALESYDSELKKLTQVIQTVQNGGFIRTMRERYSSNQTGAEVSLHKLPASIATPYLQQLIASHDFQGILANYEDSLYMRDILNHWQNQTPSYQLMLRERELSYGNNKKRVASSEHQKQITGLHQQYQQQKQKLTDIMNTHDVFALATKNENRFLQRLHRIKQRLDKMPNMPELAQQHRQYRIFKGLLTWQISTNYVPRLWRVQKGLQQTEQSLNILKQRNDSIKTALQKTPNHFSAYQNRIAQQATKISTLKLRLEQLIASQEKRFTEMASSVLIKQRQLLEKRRIRANYALTRLYDSLANVEQSSR